MFCNLIHLQSNFFKSKYSDTHEYFVPLKKSKITENRYHLINFNGYSHGEFSFNEHSVGPTSFKVNAIVDNQFKQGFLDLKEDYYLLSKVREIEYPNSSNIALSINEYILNDSFLDPSKLEITRAFMYLGIENKLHQDIIMSSKPEDISRLDIVFDDLFSGFNICMKIENYKEKRNNIELDLQCLNILDKVFKNGLEIKVINKEVPQDYTITIDLLVVFLEILRKVKFFRNLGIKNKIDQELSISCKTEDLVRLDGLFDRMFLGNTVEEKIENYNQKRLKFQDDHKSLNILNTVFKIGLSIKILKNYISIDQIPADLKLNEFEIANEAKTNLGKAVINASVDSELLVKVFLSEGRVISNIDLIETIRIAARYNKQSLIKFLLVEYKKIMSKDLIEFIKIAAKDSDQKLINILLSENKYILPKDLGDTLVIASEKNDLIIVNAILSKNIKISDGYVINSLKIAAKNGNLMIISNILSKNKPIILDFLLEVFLIAASEGHRNIIEFLLLEKLKITPEYVKEAFLIATSEGHKNVIEFLLSRKLKVTSELLESIVIKAIEYGYDDIVEVVLMSEIVSEKAVLKAFEYNKEFLFCFLSSYDPIFFEKRLNLLIKYENIVEFFLSENNPIFEERLNLIIKIAVKYKHESFFEFLLVKYKETHHKSFEDALIFAINENNIFIVDIILNNIVISLDYIEKSFFSIIESNCKKELIDFVFNFFISSYKDISSIFLIKVYVFAEEKCNNYVSEIILSNLGFNFKIPLTIKNEFFKITDPESSLERLAFKLKNSVGFSSYLIPIIEDVFLGIQFKRYLPDVEGDILTWYMSIENLLKHIDSRIDFSKKENIKDIIDLLFAFEMYNTSSKFFETSIKVIEKKLTNNFISEIFEIFSNKFEHIIALIYQNYIDKEKMAFNIHDKNRIKFYLRKFFLEELLDDPLSDLKMTKNQVILEFIKKFNLEDVIKDILNKAKLNIEFKNEIENFYQNKLFIGCQSNHEIESKIDLDRSILETSLENLETYQSFFNSLYPILGILKFDYQIKILHGLKYQLDKWCFKTLIEQNLFNEKINHSFSDEEFDFLFEKRRHIILTISFFEKIKSLNYFSYKEILTNDKYQLMDLFRKRKQSKIDFYSLEDFKSKHIDSGTGCIISSGIEIILRKIGYISH